MTAYTDSEESTIVNGMRSAAEHYKEIAASWRDDSIASEMPKAERERLAVQFDGQEADALRLAEKVETVGITPREGTGACICRQSPATVREAAKHFSMAFELMERDMRLDHRCSHHGEKAQPALWGRHKELELSVTPAQWLSLGVEHP
jgi:putative sterol carrier protein